MARKMKGGGGKVVYALMGLLILGLGGFGVTNFGGTIRSVASVGDRDIAVDDYARALQREMQAVTQQVGQPVGLAGLQALGRDAAVRGALFAQAALDNEVARIGISVGDDEVRQRLMAAPEFQGPTGQFDRDTYAFVLRQERMSEADYETRLREEAARTLLQAAVIGGLAAPETYGATVTAWATETRSFTHAELIEADLPEPVPEPTAADLQDHYDGNIAAFTSLETRDITYVWLSPEALVAEVQVDDAALRDAYEQRLAEFVTPERRLVERLVYPSDAEAVAAKARIDAGTATFADLAAERGLALADLDLGEVSKTDLGNAGPAVFAMQAPGVVGPLPSDLGPALFAMNAVLAAQETTFDEARDDLLPEIALDRARRLVLERSAAIEDELAGGATLEEVAAASGLQLGTIALDATTEDGIAAYAGFRKAALAATAGDYPSLAELEDGGVFALRLDAIRAPAPIPLDEVKGDVAASWRVAETQERLAALAAGTLAQLDGGATLEGLGLVVTRHENAERGEFIEGLPPAVLQEVFVTADGAHAVVEAEGVHLVRVDGVTASDPADADVVALRGSVDGQLRQAIANDLYAAYVTALQAEAGITLNAAAIEAVHAQLR